MFSGSQSTRLLSVYPFQSAALTIWNELPVTSSHRASLVSSKISLSCNWTSQGWAFRDQHLSWSLNICLSPSIWSYLWVLFSVSLFESYLQSAVGNSCHKPIMDHVLYCLYRAAASSVYILPSEVRLFVTDVLSVRRMSLTSVLMCSDFYAGKCLLVLLWLGYICCVEWHLKWA